MMNAKIAFEENSLKSQKSLKNSQKESSSLCSLSYAVKRDFLTFKDQQKEALALR